MWDHSKSLRLSELWIKGALACWIMLGVSFPFIGQMLLNTEESWGVFMALFYVFSIPLCIVLGCLNRLLVNIKNGDIFVKDNVRQLRRISWSCFWGALILLIGATLNIGIILIAGIMGFFGLLMRVIKNVFSEAIIIKDENDYTI